MALPLLRAGAASRKGRGKLDQDEPGARFHGSLAPSVGRCRGPASHTKCAFFNETTIHGSPAACPILAFRLI